jgi:uncharacterized protein YkwD
VSQIRNPLAAALLTLSMLTLSAPFANAAAAARTSRAHAHPARAGHAACLARSSRRVRSGAHHKGRRRLCRAHAPTSHLRRTVATPRVTFSGSSPTASLQAGAAAAATSRSATIADALNAVCSNTESMPEAGNLAAIRAAVLCLINRERAQNGEMPLKVSAQLEAAAEEHSQELIADDYFAHVSPSGVTPVDRIRSTGYIPSPSDGYVIGENLAWGTLDLATPQAIVSAWIASPEHLANILEAQYAETGIGIAPAVPSSLAEGAPGATYAQEFGVIIP